MLHSGVAAVQHRGLAGAPEKRNFGPSAGRMSHARDGVFYVIFLSRWRIHKGKCMGWMRAVRGVMPCRWPAGKVRWPACHVTPMWQTATVVRTLVEGCCGCGDLLQPETKKIEPESGYTSDWSAV